MTITEQSKCLHLVKQGLTYVCFSFHGLSAFVPAVARPNLIPPPFNRSNPKLRLTVPEAQALHFRGSSLFT